MKKEFRKGANQARATIFAGLESTCQLDIYVQDMLTNATRIIVACWFQVLREQQNIFLSRIICENLRAHILFWSQDIISNVKSAPKKISKI